MGKDATVPSDADVALLSSFFVEARGHGRAGTLPKFFLDGLPISIRAALANEPGYEEWDHVRAAWALLCRERTRMTKVLRQEAACQNGKDRDDAPYAAAVLAMVADELEAMTGLIMPTAAGTVLSAPAVPPAQPVAPDKAHDEAPPTIEAVVTVLAREALRAGTMHPNDTKRLLVWLSTSHNPNAR